MVVLPASELGEFWQNFRRCRSWGYHYCHFLICLWSRRFLRPLDCKAELWWVAFPCFDIGGLETCPVHYLVNSFGEYSCGVILGASRVVFGACRERKGRNSQLYPKYFALHNIFSVLPCLCFSAQCHSLILRLTQLESRTLQSKWCWQGSIFYIWNRVLPL